MTTTGTVMSELTVGYKGHAGAWTGVVKLDGRVILDCGHTHQNRDHGRARPATTCALRLVNAATDLTRDGSLEKELHVDAIAACHRMVGLGVSRANAADELAKRHVAIDIAMATIRRALACGATVRR